jgi:rubrerythrin
MIRVSGQERAEAFLRSLGAHPSREAQEGTQGPLTDDSAITWSGKCGSCGLALFKYGATWVCPTCDSIDLWPALEGESFYDQEADDA